jgi:hypothetical protein
VGHCYEFGVDIVLGCGHAMTVSSDGGVCECPTCGAGCDGKFEACAQVLEQPGYVPVTAPRWAVERRAPEEPAPTRSRLHGSTLEAGPVDVSVIDLTKLRDETRTLVDTTLGDVAQNLSVSLQGATSGVIARVRSEIETELASLADTQLRRDSRDLRVDIEGMAEEIRGELERSTKHQLAAVERLADTVQHLVEQAEADHVALRSVIEGLERLARRVIQLG